MNENLLQLILPCVGVVILVAVVAFFAASETAYLSITRVMLHQLKKNLPSKKSPEAKVIALKGNTNFLLSLILIGINFITSLASSLAAMVAINLVGDAGSAYATIIISFILIIFGEIMPKTVAAVFPMRTAILFAPALTVLEKLLFPLVWLFSKITDGITKLLSLFFKGTKDIITEDELKSLIAVGEHEGTLDSSEKKMLYKIFEFTDLKIHDIMRHKSHVRFVSENSTYSEIADLFEQTGYSRLPVCRESFDDVIGVLYYMNVLTEGRVRKDDKKVALRCMRPALFVPETLTATELLQKFRHEGQNFAIAIDETGSNIGIVTMDDIMRAVFGRSVYDESMDIPPENRIIPISAKEYIVPGDMKIDDVNELLKIDIESEDYDTLAGWLLEQFDALPEAGETIKRNEIIYNVEDQSQRRIQTVRIILP